MSIKIVNCQPEFVAELCIMSVESMPETLSQKITFTQLVDAMEAIREKGGTAIVKRENFLDFPQVNEGIEFKKNGFLMYASFGYIERLFRKLAAHYPESKYSRVVVESYHEACGFFTGKIVVRVEDDAKIFDEIIEFSWAGKGEIEDTWDNFTTWKTNVLV